MTTERQLQIVLGPRGGIVAKILLPAGVPAQPLPPIVRGRKKSDSLRGKEFRAKKKKYADSLCSRVLELSREVQDLELLRCVRQEHVLSKRNMFRSSLVRVVETYFQLFARGMSSSERYGGSKRGCPDEANQLVTVQESFVRHNMVADLHFGAEVGVDSLLLQWKRYSSFHSRFQVTVQNIKISGSEDHPTVEVTSELCVTFSRATFEHVFPHVAHDEAFVQKYIGLRVKYGSMNSFSFTSDGRIAEYTAIVDFVSALSMAGMSLHDIARLMQHAYISNQYRLGNDRFRRS